MRLLVYIAAAFLLLEVIAWFHDPSSHMKPIMASRSLLQGVLALNVLEAIATLVLWSQSGSKFRTIATVLLLASQALFVSAFYADRGKLHTTNKFHAAVWPFLQVGVVIALLT